MKVYVDELPKSCAFCPCYDCELGCCDISDVDLYIYENFNRYKQIHKDCPLHTISDHDKQVCKQVCDEIREKVVEFTERKSYKTGSLCNFEYANGYCYGLQYDLAKILDQIEKGEINENNKETEV